MYALKDSDVRFVFPNLGVGSKLRVVVFKQPWFFRHAYLHSIMIYESFPSLQRFVQLTSQWRTNVQRHADYVFYGWGVEHELCTNKLRRCCHLLESHVCVSSELKIVLRCLISVFFVRGPSGDKLSI
jgi:hypothetical protein